MSDDATRPALFGVSWFDDNGFLSAGTCDGINFITQRSAVAVADQLLPASGTMRGIILPPRARAEILSLASKAKGDVQITTSASLLEARTEHAVYVTKLIGAQIYEFHRLIPPPHATAIEIDKDLLLAALQRVTAASNETISPIVGLSWDADSDANTLRLELPLEPGAAADAVAAVVHGSARVALQAARLGELIDALKTKSVRICASQPIRIEPLGDTSTLALLAPARWPAQARKAA